MGEFGVIFIDISVFPIEDYPRIYGRRVLSLGKLQMRNIAFLLAPISGRYVTTSKEIPNSPLEGGRNAIAKRNNDIIAAPLVPVVADNPIVGP